MFKFVFLIMENLKTLNGVKIVLTRSAVQSAESVEMFRSRGAEVLAVPAIEIKPSEKVPELHRLAAEFKLIDYIIFTSVNSVKYFYEYREKHNLKLNLIGSLFIAIGDKTAKKLREHYAGEIYIPANFDSSTLAEEIKNTFEIKNKTVLIPRSDIGRNTLPDALDAAVADVISAVVYRNVIPAENRLPDLKEKLDEFKDAYFIFSSPSTFNNFLILAEIEKPSRYFEGKKVVAIGPVTKSEIESSGITNVLMPERATMEGIREMIEMFVR